MSSLKCTTTRMFWHEVKSLIGIKLPRMHPHTWASDILRDDIYSDKDHSVFTIGMYSLWTQRNKHRHVKEQLAIATEKGCAMGG